MTNTPTITVRAGDLRPVLTTLAKVVKKEKAAPPVLQHLKVDVVSRSSLRFTATNGDSFFTITMPATIPANAEPYLIPLLKLQEAIRGAKAADIVPIRQFKTLPVRAFPEVPVLRAKPIPLNPEITQTLLHALQCSSKDETRYVLQGAYLDVRDRKRQRIVGTDGRQLFQSHHVDLKGLTRSIILPSLPVLYSPIMSGTQEWQLRVQATKRKGSPDYFRLEGTNWSLVGKLIEGNFPNYQQVIPPDSDFKSGVQFAPGVAGPLIRAIARLPGKKISNRPVGLHLTSKTVSVIARETERDDCEEVHLPRPEKKGKNLTVFMNRDYMSNALRFGMRQFEMIDETSPIKCTGRTGIMIIMPVRANQLIKIKHSQHLRVATGEVGSPQKRELTSEKPKPESHRPNTREPMPTKQTPTPLPIENAAEKIAEIREALKAAASGLSELTACLRVSRQEQKQTNREVRSIKQTLRSLRKVRL